VCIAIRVLGIFQPFSLSETTNFPRGSIGEAWRTDAERIKEMVLEQSVSQGMESQKQYRRRSECLVGMNSVVAVIGIFLFILGF
jgi:hypothetical protein